jgi:integrase/recombinase XerD
MKQQRSVGAAGPLDGYAPGFRSELLRRGYAATSVHHRLRQFRELSRWLRDEGLAVGELDEARAARFVAARRAGGRVTWVSAASLALPLQHLRSIGAAPERVDASLPDTLELLLGEYRGYLVAERGLAADTIRAYLRIARCFCREMDQRPGGLGNLQAADVTAFVVAACERSSTPTAKKTVTALASLLRYLHVAGVTGRPLAVALPKVAGYQRGRLRYELEADDVARLLSGCDRRRSVGRRDYAILMLLCRLGLRAGELAALTLDDIDWRHGEIVVRGKGNRHELMPVPVDVGEAVVSYLRRGRRRVPRGCRALFVRAVAPEGALNTSSVRDVVSRAARRAGLPEMGPHLLRHAAATELLRKGAALPEVAQVLRHRRTQVTAAYATVAPAAVRELARPWPGTR